MVKESLENQRFSLQLYYLFVASYGELNPKRLKRIAEHDLDDNSSFSEKSLIKELIDYGYSWVSENWFSEQVSNRKFYKKIGRGIAPLPEDLGLFSKKGYPLKQLKRDAFIRLYEWVLDIDKVLDFAFPEGLSEGKRKKLHSELVLLNPFGFYSPPLGAK